MFKKYYNHKYFKDRDHLDLHIAESIRLLAKSHKLKAILDVGCGTGRLVEFLKKWEFAAIGCDPYVKFSKKSYFVRASATNLPFKNNSFDLVSAISVVEHLSLRQAQGFLKEATRVLKKSGFIFIITPNFASPLRFILKEKWFGYSDPTHKTFYTPKSMSALLRKHGFTKIKFRLKTAYNVNFDWYLPKVFRQIPMPFKNLLNYLMISSPLSTFRDSFWVAAQKCPAKQD